MERHGTSDVGVRVEHLENAVDALHRDSVRTQAALAGLATKVDSVTSTLVDIANKLDQHRTKRPDMQGIAAVLSLVLIIGGLALTPLYWRVDRIQVNVDDMAAVQWQRSGIIARYDADREHWSENISRLQEEVHRLEDKVEKSHKND